MLDKIEPRADREGRMEKGREGRQAGIDRRMERRRKKKTETETKYKFLQSPTKGGLSLSL